MSNDENKITVRLCNKQPVELVDFTESLLSIGQQYVRFLAKNPEIAESKDIRLYIKEVRPGSIIADLIPLAPYAMPFVENMNSIIGFGGYVLSFGKFLLGKDKKKETYEKLDYEQFSKILTPIAKDNSAQFNLSVVINGNVKQEFTVGHIEANAMQNSINREMKSLTEPIERLHKKVVLYWYQARNDPKSKVGDKGIIESISMLPVKTIFAFDALKREMVIQTQTNPFTYAYLVDVFVETISGKPVIYKVIEFYEKFEKPKTDEDEGQRKLFNP